MRANLRSVRGSSGIF